jgi:hypothetical protein
MAGNTVNLPQHIMAGAPGTAMLGANTRVKGQPGFFGTQTDALMFANGGTGNWIAANVRTRVLGTFTVSASSQGIAVIPGAPPVTVPVLVTTGDPRIRSL